MALMVWVLALYATFSARAQAAGPLIKMPSRSSLLSRPLPPAPLSHKPSGFGGVVSSFIDSIRPSIPREKTDREREASVSSIRANGLSVLGASLAGIGVSTGASMSLAKEKGSTLPFTVGPRLFPGGGGLGISIKW